MLFNDPRFNYIFLLTAFLSISFAIGIMLGFKISLYGDALAVLLVGLGSIILQAYLLPPQFNLQSWILYSTIGTTIGVALNFLLIKILVDLDLIVLDISHVITFPVTLIGLILAQYFYLLSNMTNYPATSWVVSSFIGFGLAIIVISLLSILINFEFNLLATREEQYSAMIKWALLGLVLGLCYTISTSRVLKDWY